MSCSGKVALVTGASRGIGRGIALALAKEGAKVYITGRKQPPRSDIAADLHNTAAEVSQAGISSGGACIAEFCDHADDAAVEKVIETIFEREGRIDVLVNNAFGGTDYQGDITALPFWEKPLNQWDTLHKVGLRSHYVATSLCARKWVPRKQRALVLNISSAAGLGFVFDVAYGVGKAGVDRLTADTAQVLKQHDVTVVGIWPGAVATEYVKKSLKAGSGLNKDSDGGNSGHFEEMESVEFSGRGCAALAADKNVMRFSGRILMTPELAEEYEFTDVDGKVPWGNFLKMARQAMQYPPKMWQLPEKKMRASARL